MKNTWNTNVTVNYDEIAWEADEENVEILFNAYFDIVRDEFEKSRPEMKSYWTTMTTVTKDDGMYDDMVKAWKDSKSPKAFRKIKELGDYVLEHVLTYVISTDLYSLDYENFIKNTFGTNNDSRKLTLSDSDGKTIYHVVCSDVMKMVGMLPETSDGKYGYYLKGGYITIMEIAEHLRDYINEKRRADQIAKDIICAFD